MTYLSPEQVAQLLMSADSEWEGVLRRLLPKLFILPNECWFFTGARNAAGYGVIGVGRRGEGTVLTHRAVYAAMNGPLVAGMHIDHLCKVEGCCKPSHLEQVTPAVNKERSWNSAAVKAVWAAQTHCSSGHPFTVENTYFGSRNGYTTRQCKTCTSSAARRSRKKEMA